MHSHRRAGGGGARTHRSVKPAPQFSYSSPLVLQWYSVVHFLMCSLLNIKAGTMYLSYPSRQTVSWCKSWLFRLHCLFQVYSSTCLTPSVEHWDDQVFLTHWREVLWDAVGSDREHSKGAEQQCSVVWQQCNAVGFGSLEAAAPPIALICCQRCLGKRGGGCDRRVGFVVAASFSFQNDLRFRWVDKKNIIQARLVSDALEVTFYIGWVLGAPLSDIYFEGYERYVHFIGQISRYVHNISIYI